MYFLFLFLFEEREIVWGKGEDAGKVGDKNNIGASSVSYKHNFLVF